MQKRWAWIVVSSLGLAGCGEVAEDEAEVPAEPVWVLAAPMKTARTAHRSVVLHDGRVLVLGGYGATGYLRSAEVYDPVTNTWSDAPDMVAARAELAATLLPDGTVLVTGGTDGPPHYLDSAELYDPAGMASQALSPMNHPHVAHTATLLADGKEVFVIGGRGNFAKDIVEIYDVETQTFAPAPDSADAAHHAHSATLLPSGQVLVVGGYDPNGPLDLVGRVLPNMADGLFWVSSKTGMAPRARHVAARLPDLCPDGSPSPDVGNVLVAGGVGFNTARFDRAEILDWETNEWQDPAPPTMSRAREIAAAAVTAGYVVVTGGQAPSSNGNTAFVAIPDAERYDPCARRWLELPAMTDSRQTHTAEAISRGRVLVVGGTGAEGHALDTAEMLWPNAACASQYDCSDGNLCSMGRCVQGSMP